ncbi:hypothetical protein DIPPA_24302 [Diplonema papillatum]|nr:hypothetical protein DIPPA_24302 [Diplonema papillatum]
MDRSRLLHATARRFVGYRGKKKDSTSLRMGFKEACDVLGIRSSPTLTMKQVYAERDRLAMLYHPDKSGGAHATEKWHQLQEAMKVLRQALRSVDSRPLAGAAAGDKSAHKASQLGKDEWASATHSLYRVNRWRTASRGRNPSLLGAAVQGGLLEESTENDEEAEKDIRNR